MPSACGGLFWPLRRTYLQMLSYICYAHFATRFETGAAPTGGVGAPEAEELPRCLVGDARHNRLRDRRHRVGGAAHRTISPHTPATMKSHRKIGILDLNLITYFYIPGVGGGNPCPSLTLFATRVKERGTTPSLSYLRSRAPF